MAAARARRSGARPACTVSTKLSTKLSTTLLTTLVTTMLPSCGGDQQRPAPVAHEIDRMPAEAVPAAVLDACHRPLRGRMGRLAATLTLADGTSARAFAELPDRMRVVGQRGMFLLRDGNVHRLDDRQPESGDVPYVRQLTVLLDASAFGPLHRAETCTRTGDGGFEVRTDDGAAWLLRLRPGTLLPHSLTHEGDEVRFDDYLRTTTTWVVKTATIAGLGRVDVLFDDGGIAWRDGFFAVPASPDGPRQGGTGPRRQRINAPGAVVESQSETPIVVEQKQIGWVVLADPGDWPARVSAYAPVHAELERQQQWIAGFPPLWTEGGERWLAAPFRQRPGKQALTAPAEWQLRTFAAGRWLVVYPPVGDVEQRMRTGRQQLTAALEQLGLRARGPITAQPFLHLHEGVPSAEKLATAVVRMAVPIE